MKTPTRLAALAVLMSFFAQTTGAADIAFLVARPQPGRPPLPLASAMPAARRHGPVAVPRESLLARLAASLGRPLLEADAVRAWADESFRLAGAPGQPLVALKGVEPRTSWAAARLLGGALAFLQVSRGILSTPVYRTKVEGRWRQAGGLVYRINFLDSVGISWADGKGLHAYVPYRGRTSAATIIPASYAGEYGTYYADSRADYEIELVNVGAGDLREVLISAGQERFNPAGGPGEAGAVEPGSAPTRLAFLLAGQRVVVRRTAVMGHGPDSVNLEQTHLVISAKDASGADGLLADDPQAGLVDPPR